MLKQVLPAQNSRSLGCMPAFSRPTAYQINIESCLIFASIPAHPAESILAKTNIMASTAATL
jgi:hypothetical protein